MSRVICELKDGSAAYVCRGEVVGENFIGLTLTKSKSHAAKFANAYDIASAINCTLAQGFYPSKQIAFAR